MKTLILHENAFGLAVADDLAPMLPDVLASRLRDALADGALEREDIGFIAIVASRAHPSAFAAVAERAWQRRIPLTFALFQGPLLVCGPVVVRGAGPCHACYVRRDNAHMEAPRMPDHEQVLRRAYDQHPDMDSPGFLPTEVRMAALSVLGHIRDPLASVGRFSMTTRIESRRGISNVIALHGCPCRLPEGVAAADLAPRQLRRLEPILKEVLG
jgi:hypothetical protein